LSLSIAFALPGNGQEATTALWIPRRWREMVDVYEKITSKIIELLEAGTVPWRQPWSGAVPTNLASMKPYNGINFLLLGCLGFESNFWVTFKQSQKLGGRIVAGENLLLLWFIVTTW
jgi:antirestriction protein ArdC